jgi:hypothetical protein
MQRMAPAVGDARSWWLERDRACRLCGGAVSLSLSHALWDKEQGYEREGAIVESGMRDDARARALSLVPLLAAEGGV